MSLKKHFRKLQRLNESLLRTSTKRGLDLDKADVVFLTLFLLKMC